MSSEPLVFAITLFSNAEAFVQINRRVPGSKTYLHTQNEAKSMKITYLLLKYRNERQIKRLIARLRHGSDSFVLVHHDYSKGT